GYRVAARADLFGREDGRPGHLIDHFLAATRERPLSAARLLTTLLDSFASIWPSPLMRHGNPIGDAGRHSAVRTGDDSEGIVPFHKLSQWLAYSLIEPLEAAGVGVCGGGGLTALPEYPNRGVLHHRRAPPPPAPPPFTRRAPV